MVGRLRRLRIATLANPTVSHSLIHLGFTGFQSWIYQTKQEMRCKVEVEGCQPCFFLNYSVLAVGIFC